MNHRRRYSMPCRIARASLAALAAAAPAAALELDQFAVGWPLEVPETPGFYDIPLTLEMYQSAGEIEQLAVLDFSGWPMSFYRASVPRVARSARRAELAASPVYAARQDGTDLTVETASNAASVTVTRDGEAAPEVVAFVLDARAAEAAASALELEWRPHPQPFLMEVRIEQSQTLDDWRTVGQGSIASLSIDGAALEHRRVPVSGVAGGYYRITWNRRDVPDWQLERATLIAPDLSQEPPTRVVRFAPLPAAAAPQEGGAATERTLYFDLGGRVPVSAATLDFTASNRWATGRLESADALDGPWEARSRSRLFYQIGYEGDELMSQVIEVGRVEHRYWRAVLASPSLPGAIELQVRYPQEHLRFVASGVGPYMLVGGTVSPAAGPDPTLEAVWNDLRPARPPPRTVGVGERVELGGAAALVLPLEVPWNAILLWTALLGGVAAVGAMAFKLLRALR